MLDLLDLYYGSFLNTNLYWTMNLNARKIQDDNKFVILSKYLFLDFVIDAGTQNRLRPMDNTILIK